MFILRTEIDFYTRSKITVTRQKTEDLTRTSFYQLLAELNYKKLGDRLKIIQDKLRLGTTDLARRSGITPAPLQ